MTEKLLIKNFAGLRDVELELRPVTLLIGPQATGKSIIAKTLLFFRLIGGRVIPAGEKNITAEQFIKDHCAAFCRYFPPVNWRGTSFSIFYESGKGQVHVEYSGGEIANDGTGLVITLSEGYTRILRECATRRSELVSQPADPESEVVDELWLKVRPEFEAQLIQYLGPWANFQQVFIPAARAFFAQVQKSVFTALEEGSQIDPFLVNFGKLFEQSQGLLERQGFFLGDEKSLKRWQAFRSAFATILKADWVKEENDHYLVSQDGRKVRLAQASSGQQEAFPLLLLLGRFWSMGHKHGRAVYVEEPEAHLFPATQRAVVGLLARTFRTRQDQMRLVVTTHSPYVLTAFNNLLHAGVLYSEADGPEKLRLNKIISEKWALRPGDIVAYALEDGGAKTIMDPETKLVNAQIIDSVSNDLAKEFDRLLWEGK